jgi:predicted nicotinamide N-methyase
MSRRSNTDLSEIERRFGLVERNHRIGEMNLRIAQVDRVDDMVHEVYPEAVSVHGDAPVWMITWPAALSLAEYLVLSEEVTGRRILELGCGTAAPGIALEMAGARAVCTDYDPLALSMAEYNAGLNGCRSLETHLLDWYAPDLPGGFDLVVGSEIVYFEKSFSPLLDVLCRYTAPQGRVILSDQGRPQMKPFLEMCTREGFEYEQRLQTVHLPELSRQIHITTLRRTG